MFPSICRKGCRSFPFSQKGKTRISHPRDNRGMARRLYSLGIRIELKREICSPLKGGNGMLGRDGTGPMGKGPLTGTCSGSCILKIADNPDELILGFAGEAGRRVSIPAKPGSEKEELDMPRGDGTGPTGAGPGTGRMRGFCMGFGTPEALGRSQSSAFPGRSGGSRGRRNPAGNAGTAGWQRGSGFGFGREPGGSAAPATNSMAGSQLETLKSQAQHLEEALDGIKQRIQQMESRTETNQ